MPTGDAIYSMVSPNGCQITLNNIGCPTRLAFIVILGSQFTPMYVNFLICLIVSFLFFSSSENKIFVVVIVGGGGDVSEFEKHCVTIA